MTDIHTPSCSHGDDLVAVLYNEATETESKAFKQHMLSCIQCREEFEAFRGLREPIMAWRNESLGVVAEPGFGPAIKVRKRSASAALREFFALSPNWMKGAVAFASVIFCVLALLTVARLRQAPVPPVSERRGYTQEEINSLVEERAQRRIAELKTTTNQVTTVATDQRVESPPQQPRPRQGQVAIENRTRGPLTRREREQLAADLRLTAADEETDLDLLGDRLSRQDD